jgi:hypothetical protein
MTPFTWLGISWACNPVLSGLTLVVLHRIARRLFDDDGVGMVMLFTIASPVFFADGISYYAMTAHLCLNGLFVLLLLDPTPRRLLAAGFVGSVALTLHNPVPHTLFAIPWLVWIALRPQAMRNLALLAAGYLPLCALLGIGWWMYINGLSHAGVPAAETHTGHQVATFFALPTANVFSARLVGAMKVHLWAVPVLLSLAIIGAWRLWRQPLMRLLALSALLTYFGYFFIPPDQGHGWGFRYFHSAWLALPLLAAGALARVSGQATNDNWVEDIHLRTFVVASAVIALFAANGLRAVQIDEFISDMRAQVPAGPVHGPQVIFVDPTHAFYGRDLVQNDPFLRDEVIRMISRGTAQNARFMQEFRPGYVQRIADYRGEVWAPAPNPGSP